MSPRDKGIMAALTFVLAVSSALFIASYTVVGATHALLHGEILYGLYMLLLALPLGAIVGTFWAVVALMVKR